MTGLINHRYRILKALAEGGFGQTFLAEDLQLPSRRRCVVKQLKPDSLRLETAQTVQAHFAREAAVLESVSKGNSQVPDLYAYCSEGGRFYLVQEWVEGRPLHEMVPPAWSEERTVDFLLDVLPALALVHQHNIIHRDIKPENIILRAADQLPCLIDFGAVKAVMSTAVIDELSDRAADRSIIVGTPGFMSPEQAAGRPTFSSDLYSLGMTAIYLLTGRSPQDIPVDSYTGQVLWQQYASGVSDRTAAILTRCIHLHPPDRYASAIELLAALNEKSAQDSTSIVPFADRPVVTPTVASIRRFSLPWKSVGIGGAVLVAGVFAIAIIHLQRIAEPSVITSSTETAPKTKNDIAELTALIDSAETSLRENPENEPARNSLALHYQQRAEQLYAEGREALALADIERLVASELAQSAAFELRGDILVNQSRPDFLDAIAAYTQALNNSQTSATNTANVLGKRCRAHMALKNWVLSESDCTQSLSFNDTNPDIYAARGDIYAAQNEFARAAQQYDIAIDISQKNGIDNRSLYYRRSQAREKSGDIEGALSDLQHIKTPR